MKKNRMMRLASILLVLVLMTSSVVGGTFAKYTTSATGTDSARVAKWGFESDGTITINGLFQKAYTTAGGTVSGDTVVSSNDENVIAPGTKNAKTFTFNYDKTSNGIQAPEVAYVFTVSATTTAKQDAYAKLDANPNFFWTLKAAGAATATPYGDFDELLAAINALDGTAGETGKEYGAGDLPTTFFGADKNGSATCEIGWEWKFENTDEAKKIEQDKTDTDMGNADILDKLDITITVSAVQVD